MAKKKANSRRKPKAKPQKSSWGKGLLRFFLVSPFRYWYVSLAVIVVALAVWQWANLVDWANNIAESTLTIFGWGLLLVLVAVITLVVALRRFGFASVARRWHRWLAGLVLLLAIWGILSFFSGEGVFRRATLGGNFGLGIIGDADAIGVLRVVGLVIVGVVLAAPGACFRFLAGCLSKVGKFIVWTGRLFRRQPMPGQKARTEPSMPVAVPIAAPPELSPTQVKREEVTPTTEPVPVHEELRQVAQDVWKKYGESPDLVDVDGWRLPPIDILDKTPEIQLSQADNVQRAQLIEEALTSYGVEGKVVQINSGPTVTQFGVEPGWDRKTRDIRERDKDGNIRVRQEEISRTRVKVDRINNLSNDLALALAAPSIRIEAPVPGKSVVGIEVPNTVSTAVSLRGVIETSVFQKMGAKSKLSLALGKGAGGEAVTGDLARMPHLLIAGATGSGKTVCLNAVVCCLLMYNTPNDLRFIMIDPKRVELTSYNSIPHLDAPVIVDAEKAVDALRWLGQEMDKRYQKLAAGGVRNIEAYNKNKQGEEKMPYLVLVIDELADLMMAGGDEVEHILCRLAQLSRAVGIHLVVATQRPSVDVVTGLIKANFPTRISFAVTSQVDSRTILDGGGAEKLLGKGDMLYMPTEAGKPKRLQGCFVSDVEIERLVYLWGSQRREEAAQLRVKELIPTDTANTRKTGYPDDPLLAQARKLAEEHQHISTSFLQRRLRIGYPRAARIMEQLQEEQESGEGEGE